MITEIQMAIICLVGVAFHLIFVLKTKFEAGLYGFTALILAVILFVLIGIGQELLAEISALTYILLILLATICFLIQFITWVKKSDLLKDKGG